MERVVVESIEIEASPERVFAAWTDPEQLVAWWGDDQMYRTTGWETDPRVGGKWVSHGTGVDGKAFSVEGEYLQYDPPKRLGFTWIPSYSSEGRTVVELEFKATATGTLLTVKHSGFESDQSAEGHKNGWQRVFGWMKNFVEAKAVAS
jgi:uncharacterized protein YndB with AHSA1/START domain